MGIATVSCQSSKIRKDKGQLQYYANVALKVNIKLGGINHSIEDSNMAWLKSGGLTMIVGADVTHPSAGSITGTPSIAAAVGSVDEKFGQFPASLRIQKSRQEV